MNDLKSQIKTTLTEVFQKTQDLKINEVEFGLRNFWEVSNIYRSKDPAYGVILFDKLSRVLKGMNYKLIGPKYQLVISTPKFGHESQRATLNNQSTIQNFCEDPSDQKIQFYYETKTREQTNADSELEKEYGLRLRMSEERERKEVADFGWVRDEETQKTFRYRKRYTFKVPIKGMKPEDGSINIDLSIYKEGTGISFKKATFKESTNIRSGVDKRFMTGPESYDIEIEYQPAKGKYVTDEKLTQILDWMIEPVYNCLQIVQDSPIIMSKTQRQTIYQNYLKLIGKTAKDSPASRFVGANVYPMGIERVLAGPEFEPVRIPIDDYAFTIKADGVRNLLFIDDERNCYLIDMNHEVRNIGVQSNVTIGKKLVNKCLFDIELIDNSPSDNHIPEPGKYKILAFDALFFNGDDIREQPLFPDISEETQETPETKETKETKVKKAKKTPRFEQTIFMMTQLSKQVVENAFYSLEAKIYYRTPYYRSGPPNSPTEPKSSQMKVVTPHPDVFSPYLKPLKDLIKLENNYAKEGAYPKDGLILTKMFEPYPLKSDEKALIFSLKVKNLDQLSIDFLYRPTSEKVPGVFGESLKYSLWIQRDGVAPFRPIYSVLPNYNTASVPMIKQSEGASQDQSGILNTVMRTMNSDGTSDKDGFLIFPDFVYESVYKNDNGIVGWIPTRHRPIKTLQEKPNYYKTANSTWEMILNILENPKSIGEITEDNLIKLMSKYIGALEKTKSKISFEDWLAKNLERPKNFYNSNLDSIWEQTATKNPLILPMSQMHNQVKSLLYQATTQAATQAVGKKGLRLLELASGKGPDYIRWLKNGIDYVVGIEIDPNQIDAAIERYNDEWKRYRKNLAELKRNKQQIKGSQTQVRLRKPVNVKYLQGDMTKDLKTGMAGKTLQDQENLLKFFQFDEGRKKFDIVSCQFAIHFAMKDEATFTQFIKNVSQNLVLGGFFIGTSFIATRNIEEQKNESIGPGLHDRLKDIKTKPSSTKTSSTTSPKHDLSYIDPATKATIWTIDKGPSFKQELTDFGQDVLVYLSTLHRAEPNKEYLVNLTSERVIEIAAHFNLKMIQLPVPDSLIGKPGEPQAFGDVYDKIEKDEIVPVEMKAKGKPMDVKATLAELLGNKAMAEFSRFNSLFVFQKIAPQSSNK